MEQEQQTKKPGRKPGRRPGAIERRTDFLQVYFTPAEKRDFQGFCDSIGVAASVYIRDLIDKDRAARSK